jgi:hypothetical protein
LGAPSENGRAGMVGVAIGRPGFPAVDLPPFLKALAEIGGETSGIPVVVILPDNQRVAEAVVMLCAREGATRVQRNPDEVLPSLVAGGRVRVLPDAGVYHFDGPGNNGFWLAPLDVRHKRTAARFWVPKAEAKRLEPTVRKRPMGEAGRHNWRRISPTPWDLFAGTNTFGNAALTRLAVILVGQRADFRQALEHELGFAGGAGEPSRLVFDGLPWGDVDEEAVCAFSIHRELTARR